MNWIITIPKTISWEIYQKELNSVKNGNLVLNYRVPYKPKIKIGDRIYITWNGKVRGWMACVGVAYLPDGFTCTTAGAYWKPGYYVQRSGEFNKITEDIGYKGFQGIRRYY